MKILSKIDYRHVLWLLLISFIVLIGEIGLGVAATLSPVIGFLILFSLIVGVATLINPDLGLTILILVLPFSAQFTLDLSSQYAISMVSCQIIFLMFIKLISLSINKEDKLCKSNIDIPLAVFFIWCIMTLFWVTNLSLALLHLFSIFSAFALVYVMINSVHSDKTFDRLLWSWWLMAILMGMIGFLQFAGLKIGTLQEETRVAGFSGIGNEFARLMMVSAFMLMGFYRSREKGDKYKLLLLIGIVMTITNMLFALSRTSLIGAFFGLFLFSTRGKDKKFSILGVIVMMIVFTVLLGIASNLSEVISERVQSIANFTQDYSWQSRLVIWTICFKLFFQSPVFGVGLGGIEDMFFNYDYLLMDSQKILGLPPNSHSLYLDVLVHFGIIGFVIFAWLLIKLILVLKKAQHDFGFTKYGEILWGINCGLIAVAIQSMIASVLHTFNLWIFIGLALVTVQMGYKFIEKKE